MFDGNYIFLIGIVCSFVVIGVAVYFLGKLIMKFADAFLDRYRAKTALIRAQAEQIQREKTSL